MSAFNDLVEAERNKAGRPVSAITGRPIKTFHEQIEALRGAGRSFKNDFAMPALSLALEFLPGSGDFIDLRDSLGYNAAGYKSLIQGKLLDALSNYGLGVVSAAGLVPAIGDIPKGAKKVDSLIDAARKGDIPTAKTPIEPDGGIKRRLQDIKAYLALREGKSFDEMLDIEVSNDLDLSDLEDHEVFGIRYHKKGLKDGETVPNSYEHYDGEGHKEMSSTSTVWINKDTDIDKAISDIETYADPDRELILVGGNDWGAGLDVHTNERQIADAVKIPWSSTKKILPNHTSPAGKGK